MTSNLLVAHAGSLNSLLKGDLIPSFTANSGISVTQLAGPAVGLANRILDNEIAPDVYMSADAEVNQLLMNAPSGGKVRWFFGFATSRMVLAYSPQSRFKTDFEAAVRGPKQWYEVLQSPGLVFKRSDPRVDPGGYRSVFVLQLAERFYQLPGLRQRILQGDENPTQLITGGYPNLLDGSVDAMMLYVTSALSYGLPYIQLPDEIDLSNPALAASYRAASYTNPRGQTFEGTPALYSITIPQSATNLEGAIAFIVHLFSDQGRTALSQHGFTPTSALLGGEFAAVPMSLRSLISATSQ